MYNLKTNPWFILTNTPEDSIAAQKWLQAQGVTWCNGDTKIDCTSSKVLCNYHLYSSGIAVNKTVFMHAESQTDFIKDSPDLELKLNFYVAVDSVLRYPLSEVDQKIRTLEKVVEDTMAEIAKLKSEK